MNVKWALVKRPSENFPKNLDCFQIFYSGIPDPSLIEDGSVVVKVLYISIDAAMRIWMTGEKTYMDGVKLNDVMTSAAVGQIVFSKSKKLVVGDYVFGLLGWQTYSLMHESKKGENVVISAAAGGVGIYAVQIAKLFGGNVIALTSGKVKKNFLQKELGVQSVIDYSEIKNESRTDSEFVDNLSNELKKMCPKGIDVYFDNVGGEFLDAVLLNINNSARIICCGSISSYNKNIYHLKYSSRLIMKSALMQGYIYTDYFKEFNSARNEIIKYLKENKISEGIDNTPKALQKMFLKENIGKIIVKVKHDEDNAYAKL